MPDVPGASGHSSKRKLYAIFWRSSITASGLGTSRCCPIIGRWDGALVAFRTPSAQDLTHPSSSLMTHAPSCSTNSSSASGTKKTDAQGRVHHSNYFTYFEMGDGRIEQCGRPATTTANWKRKRIMLVITRPVNAACHHSTTGAVNDGRFVDHDHVRRLRDHVGPGRPRIQFRRTEPCSPRAAARSPVSIARVACGECLNG